MQQAEGGNPGTPWAYNPADKSLPDLLGRPSLRYPVTSLRHADRTFAMQTEPQLSSKRAFAVQKYFLKLLFRMYNKMFLATLSR